MKLFVKISLFAAALTATAIAGPKLHSIALKDIDGKETSLKAFKGKVVLVVNTASQCGLTPQYKDLEAVYQKYKEKGFTVVGFPCNDFGAQEPGTNEEIKTFCKTNYSVTFPMMDKIHVKGEKQHPLYKELTGKASKFPGEVGWNFGKFLISADGELIARFESRLKPDDSDVTQAIEKALAKK